MTNQKRIERDIARSAVDNLVILAPDHPAIAPSLKILKRLIRKVEG